ncbi:MAG: GNAT family N-acetyltransferase [Anaerolineae bacterium]|nr:GNAT family N-acetyltransferase [Anaerolineae bacterium]
MPVDQEHEAEGYAWRLAMGPQVLLRQGTRRDRLGLEWLLRTSAYAHAAQGQEPLLTLLLEHPNLIWLRDHAIRGAVLTSLYRHPVAMVRYLIVRHASDVSFLFTSALPHLEVRLARLGVEQLGFHQCPSWLIPQIEAQGYRIQDRVIGYVRNLSDDVLDPGAGLALRPTAPKDVEEVLALDHAAFPPFWRLNAPIIEGAVASSALFWVAESHERIVAYLMVEGWGSEAYVSRIAVAPDHQGQGLGSALLEQALALLARQGIQRVRLNTQEENRRSRALYAKLGFQETGESDPYWSKPLA